MTRPLARTVLDNAAYAGATPAVSVLTPFFRDDPRPLLEALDREAQALAGRVEIVVLDDAGGDPARSAAVAQAARSLALPARLVQLAANAGRAKGRNILMEESRGRHLLFLDSDMLPDRPDFLAVYLALIAAEDPAVVVGGFSVAQVELRPEHALHHALAVRADCLPAAQRLKMPEKYVWTSNLLVRRDVFEAERFDEGFRGWGWEDTEWGVRVAARFGVTHVDNQATHLGLDTASALAAKYEQSPPNFARMLARHPQMTRRFPSYRLARALRAVPLRAAWRPVLRRVALAEGAPLPARVAAMKLFRAALYAEVV
jgi:glycosyltransferase involved in cell wall biosynthesis